MPTFKDRHGKEWLIDMHLTLTTQLKLEAGVNVFELYEGGMRGIGEILADPEKLGTVLYLCCREQCLKANPPVTAEQFGSGLAGDSLSDAGEAFTRAAIDFFHDRAARPVLTKMLAKEAEVKSLAAAEALQELDKITPSVILQTLKRSFGSGAESSEPIHAPSPPASSA